MRRGKTEKKPTNALFETLTARLASLEVLTLVRSIDFATANPRWLATMWAQISPRFLTRPSHATSLRSP